MPRLFIRVLSEARPQTAEAGDADVGYDLSAEWLIRENDGSVRATGSTDYRGLADIADPNVDWLKNPDNTVVLLPSHYVLAVDCEVPGRSAAQIRRALPFAAEEYVASDIETMHIAHAPIRPGNPVLCNILPHQTMANLCDCFKSLGIIPGYFVVDAQVLPGGHGTASVLFDGRSALVSSGNQAATIDRETLLFALNSLQAQQIIVINGGLSDIERGQLDGNPEVEEILISDHGVLDYLAQQFEQAHAINLLQGQYRAERPHSPETARWQAVGGLATIWVLVAFLGMAAQAWWSGSEADRLADESFAFYKSMFPTESQPVGIDQLRRRMAAKLGQQGNASEASAFVGLTAHFANVVAAEHRVDSLSYVDQRREVTVEVILASYDDLETIKGKLSAAGVSVDVTSAEEEQGGVRSRMRVRYTDGAGR